MAGRIKGITIEFRGDTSSLSDALNTVKKEAVNTEKELKAVNNALRYNPGNITLIAQKQQLLKQRVSETTERLNALKLAQKQMANDPSVDKKSAEYRKLERDIIITTSQQKKFAREMVKFGGSAHLTKVSDGLTTVGKKLTNVTRHARIAAGAIAGIALMKGFERLKSLDETSTQLETLGYRGKELEKVMDGVKTSVSGTRFTLQDMAKVASGALGSGVTDDYQLDKYLSRTADLAQLAGISVTDMGGMMNKAYSRGKVDAELMNQLNDRGIPIYKLLQQELGVTADELMKMSRNGQISFDDLYNATSRYEGLAQSMAMKTLPGAVTVIGQQFGLMGADFLSGAYEPLKEGSIGILNYLKQLQADGTIKEWGNAVGEAIKYFVEWFRNGSAEMDNMSPKAQKLVTAFGPLIKILGSLVKFFINLPAPLKTALVLFTLFGGPLMTVAGGMLKIINMGVGFLKLTKIVGRVFQAFSLLTGINPIALAIVAGIAAVIAIGVVLYKNWDKIKEKAGQLKDHVVTAFKLLGEGIKTIVSTWFAIITWPFRKAWDLIKKVAEKIKSVFNFKFKLPKIKLPHFSISPKGWKFSDLLKGSIPSLGIDWYAKGGIFRSPSVIGVGERGPEAVLPIEKLEGMFAAMADSIVNGMSMSMALQAAGQGGEIHIENYLYPSGPKMGEVTVNTYDQYKKILG